MKQIDSVLEEDVIKSLMQQAIKEDQLDKQKIDRLNKRIAELDKSIKSNEWRDSTKRNLREWLSMFKEERKVIINKYKVRDE